MKNKWDLDGVLRQEHYRSIINLTSKYQDKEDGLRQLHYRWALIENHDNIEQTSFKKEMEEFFEKPSLKYYAIKKGYVKLGCITGKYPNNNLTNFLNKLSDPKTYGILVKHKDKDNITRYKVSDDFYDKIEIIEKSEQMKTFDNIKYGETILHRFKHEKQAYIQQIETSILGLDDAFIDKLSKEEKKDFDEFLLKAIESSVNISVMNVLKKKSDAGILLYIDAYTEKMESWVDRLADRGHVEKLPDDYKPKKGESIYQITDDGDFITVGKNKDRKKKIKTSFK